MTADVELPPSSVAAFTEALHGDRGSLDAWLEVNDEREVRAHVEAYARANVAHATAAKDAEIEALRAEVATWEGLHASEVQARQRWQARAERLAEALALLPDEIVMVEHNPYEGPLMFCCGQRVTLSWHHGLEPTHGKECWYARMRALRDHDQENKA